MFVFARDFGRIAMMLALLAAAVAVAAEPAAVHPTAMPALQQIGIDCGVCAIVGLPQDGGAGRVIDLARGSELKVYFQSSQAEEVDRVREAAAAAGLLGTRVFADRGEGTQIHLAENLAGAVLVAPAAEKTIGEAEVLRVLHPEGVAIIGTRRLVKPRPEGLDQWGHVFHAPDNNTLSTDQAVRAPYLTHFLATPLFVPMPEVSVAAGGRVFRAFGHIAHKVNQNGMLNTLICVNGYNGTVLWQRPLREGFMIHRNTMIATPETLYLADDQSCKLLDARTGQLKDEIVIPAELADGPVWKWMALQPGPDSKSTLYALVGGKEIQPATQPSKVTGLGHWPWGMWEGHDYKNPQTNFGFGRTFVAIDPATKKVLWNHREQEYLDARGVCMNKGRIYFYSPGKFVGCLDAATGRAAWKNSDQDLLDAIGRDDPAQIWLKGYSTMTFLKCNDRCLFFAGPQRTKLVVASTENGKLLWQREPGNLQLVLRDDAIYAAGAQGTCGYRFDYDGKQLGELPARRACTRATGTIDSVFFRAAEGTMRIDVASGIAKHIAPMRPPCQDGVIVSDGFLYWGPWMCGCQLSLYGHISLGPAGKFDFHPDSKTDGSRLATAAASQKVKPLEVAANDWPTYLHDSARSGVTDARLPQKVTRQWTYQVPGKVRPTAPVIAGGMVFLGDDSGAVRALDAANGAVRWQVHTGGAIFFPPALWTGRLYVGSADGRVYAFEAATGRPLWTFRAAPAERWIPVYGKLISTWPVAGGVVVQDGVVYAAAGIAHYDGTYVFALDAVTGRVKWHNDSSGSLSKEVDSGISLQGPLRVVAGELRFLGGGKYETASFDAATGKCLNEPVDTLTSQFQTAFYPYFPEYGRYVSLSRALGDGKELVYDASYEGSQHSALRLLPPLPPGARQEIKKESRWPIAPPRNAQQQQRKPLWSDQAQHRFNSLVVTPGTLLAAGHNVNEPAEESFLTAIDVATGAERWREKLPGAVVRAGTAVDHQGRIIVTLEDGRVVAF